MSREPTVNAEELRRLSEAATPGPWEWNGDTLHSIADIDGDDHVITGHVCPACAERGHYCMAGNPANRAFIVALVNAFRSNQLQVIERDRLARDAEAMKRLSEEWAELYAAHQRGDDLGPIFDRHLDATGERVRLALDSTTGDERG